ncbi:MAG: hypothetical protein JWR28_31, partial [Modestobacter sp.]|nr:hypothetical protein [Modestobacter sp.]
MTESSTVAAGPASADPEEEPAVAAG